MRNVIKRSFIALVIIALGCKKSGPGLDAKTLCDGLAPFRATATVGEMIEGTTRTVPVDTIVNFQALLQAQSNAPSSAVDYEWLISNSGSQPTRYTQPTFLLRFGPEQIGERIDVILIAKRLDASPPCPNEDNIDTVRRSFYIYTNNKADTLLHRPFIVENKIIGRWRGSYTDDPQRQFIVTITDFGFPPVLDSTTYYGVRLFNMPEGCGNRPSWASNPCAFAIAPSSYSHPIDYGGSSFAVNQPFTNDCGCTPISLYGYIPYNKRDSLVMDVRLHQVGTGNIERNRQWKGKRL